MRLVVIAWRLIPIVISFRRDYARWVWFGAPVPRTAAFHARRAQRIAATLAGLGPSFIKMAQLLGARTDVIAEPYVGALASLMDRVPVTPWPVMSREIERAYGRPVSAVFESIEPDALASASLGQVYVAQVDGQRVAVKVLRPGVERLIAADTAASRRLLDVIDWLFRGNPRVLRALRQLRIVIEEFAFRVTDEVDYRREAANAIEMGENFAGTPGIRVPAVLLPYVRRTVLVMEFMEGDALDALGPRVAAGEIDLSLLVRRLIEAYTSMMMIDGLFHADPHPKNLRVAPDGALVLLDFGMVVRVSRAMRRALLETIMAAIRKDVDGVVAGFDGLGLIAPGATREDLRPIVALLITLASRHATTQERMDLLADEVMVNLYDSPISLPSSMVYFARTASLIEGIGTRYDPRFNPLGVATPVVLRMQPAILAALGRRHAATAADWAASLTALVGDGLDVVATRLGVGQPGEVARASGRLAKQVRSWLGGNGSNGNGTNGHRP
jgi:predicted unusual protein kinase regulating ubiquinone biosynthesis (AarF/ABC1/UbiB family)